MYPLIFWLVVAGLFLWAISQIPLDPVIARILRVVVIVAVCLLLLRWLMVIMPFPDWPLRP